ncbi:MAG: zinc ribbon domain-containing protein [Opitutales bacterium]
MPSPELTPLLILQDRDVRRIDILTQLQKLPAEIAAAEAKIAKEETALADAAQALKEMEVKRSALDKELQSTEAEIVRYKSQQLTVKKQEELEALNHEITAKQADAERLEEEELETLMAIDAARAAFEGEKTEREPTIAAFRREIEALRAKIEDLKSQVGEAEAAAEAARPDVDPKYLQAYDMVKKRRPKGPFVVPVEAGKCSGCHLKIAGEVDSSLYNPTGPVTCESCGRMLYLP